MPEEIRTPEPSNEMSLSDKFVGILSSPGEVFQSIVGTEPKTSNWAIPLVLSIVFGIIFTLVVFTQPAIQDQMSEVQYKAMQKSVSEGKMTQEQMDNAVEKNPAKPGSPMFLIFGSVGVAFAMAVILFLYTLVYWIVGKLVLKSPLGYGKILEVNGLAMYIVPISTLLTMVTVVAMGSLHAQPSAALLVPDFDIENKTHKLLAALNILEFWALYITAVGLGKVWNVSLGKSLGVVGGIFVVWTAIKIFTGLNLGGM